MSVRLSCPRIATMLLLLVAVGAAAQTLRRHSFDHFMLFSVDAEETRSEPRASKQPPGPPAASPERL
jgi:hypothetical protein